VAGLRRILESQRSYLLFSVGIYTIYFTNTDITEETFNLVCDADVIIIAAVLPKLGEDTAKKRRRKYLKVCKKKVPSTKYMNTLLLRICSDREYLT